MSYIMLEFNVLSATRQNNPPEGLDMCHKTWQPRPYKNMIIPQNRETWYQYYNVLYICQRQNRYFWQNIRISGMID